MSAQSVRAVGSLSECGQSTEGEVIGTDWVGGAAAVIEHCSVGAAAAHLRVTPSAISQRIKALEQRVGPGVGGAGIAVHGNGCRGAAVAIGRADSLAGG